MSSAWDGRGVWESVEPRGCKQVSKRNERLLYAKTEEQSELLYREHAFLLAGEQTRARRVGIETERVEFQHRDIFLRIALTAGLQECLAGLQTVPSGLDAFLYRQQLIKRAPDFQLQEPFRIGNNPFRIAQGEAAAWRRWAACPAISIS